MVNAAISRAVSSLRWNDSQRIEFVSKDGYRHTVTFGQSGHTGPTALRRYWSINGHGARLSQVVWQLFENADKETIRLLGPMDAYPLAAKSLLFCNHGYHGNPGVCVDCQAGNVGTMNV
jgi:hypothetical protein